MQAAVFHGIGKPLTIEERPDPKPGPGELVLQVKSCGICGSDLHAASLPPGLPAGTVMGHEFSGEVVEIGAGVAGIKPGDRVMGRCAGGFAEYSLLDAREVMPAPGRLSWEEAACVPIVFVVVHDALFVSGQLHAGETLLVKAATLRGRGRGLASREISRRQGDRHLPLGGEARTAENLGAGYRRRHRQRGVWCSDLAGNRREGRRHGRRQHRRR